MQDSGAQRGSIDVYSATTLLRDFLAVSAAFEQHLASALNVNATDLTAMEHLIQDGPLSPTDLAARLGVTTAAMTTSIDRLTAVGHVTRAPHPSDRRGILVVPAPASIGQAMQHLLPMIQGIDQVLSSYDESDKAVITSYLARVVEVYRTHTGDVAPATAPATAPAQP